MYQKSILGEILVIIFFLQWALQLQPLLGKVFLSRDTK